MYRIALINEDSELCSMLEQYFVDEGFHLTPCFDADSGLEIVLSDEWDVVILDVCLPDKSGFELLTDLRAVSDVPVLVLSGRSDVVDMVVALEMGADDYLIKPFNIRELVARIRALIRRSSHNNHLPGKENKTLVAGDLTMCTGTRKVRVNGGSVQLTQAEFTILRMLLTAEGNLVNREDISRTALNRELTPFDRSIDVHISNLRKKLGPAPGGGNRITTVRGAGYMYTDLAPWEEVREQLDA